MMTGTRIWRIWMGLRERATNPLDKDYAGRGIGMCEEWSDFQQFYTDMIENYTDDLTIERIDVNKGYCKENCTWVTPFAQQGNKRNSRFLTYKGEKVHLAELCRRTGLSRTVLTMRLNRGMTADEAVKDAEDSPYGKSQRFLIRNGDGDVFVSHNSMGHGVDGLQDSGHIIVWYGLNWSLELYEQMNGRINRQGQKAPVSVIRILCNDTVDLAVADALGRKTDDQEGLKSALDRYRRGITTNELEVNFY